MATDADERSTPQSTLRYYLKSNTGRGLFNVDENTGEVTILNPPDFEEIHQITLSVSSVAGLRLMGKIVVLRNHQW